MLLKRLGKEHGVKVKRAQIDVTGGKPLNSRDHGPGSPYEDGVASVHYIDIPESLKNQALGKGFPLFSSGGHFLNPIPGNPHEQVDNSHHVPYGAGASNTPTGFPVNMR